LTQAELAERLGQSQSTVSQAESGAARIGKRYVERVIRACELEPDWGLPAVEAEPAISGWELEPGEIAGLDPETLEPVKRGSPRDLELSRSFVWWSNRPEI
jgi:transcriptional regulator with XRE-family HTH domain